MSVLEVALNRAKARKGRVVFPEMDDPRIAEAVSKLETDGICTAIAPGEVTEAQIAAIVATRGMKAAMSERLLRKPLYRAAAMVAAGEADTMVAGAVNSTAEVIKASAMSSA